MDRCINIDWLEVFCEECIDRPRNAEYYMSRNFVVKLRDYGTPQYREMFTIYVANEPFVEIRRNPYSQKGNGGIFKANACHIRLCNRTCYEQHPIELLRVFLLENKYTIKGISRVDICLDFLKFDTNRDPQSFIKDYMSNKISKINQSNVSAHGKDTFSNRTWNSLSWGAEKSMIRTKIYNKTLEMNQVGIKTYIRQSWYQAGLITDLNDYDTQVWRIEFSIKSEAKEWVNIADESHAKTRHSVMKNTLSCYDDREKLMIIFRSLEYRYFHFKQVEYDENGKARRKDRCKDVRTFIYRASDKIYKAKRIVQRREPTRTDRILINKCKLIEADLSLPQWQHIAAKHMRMILSNELFDIVNRNNIEALAQYYDGNTQFLDLEIEKTPKKDLANKFFDNIK